ncbi:CAP-associated domain-containing protein [Staphylococcus simiae]|nr:CAP domain-containing protein [Staphylococcus simiae]PNZ13681.1 SCP-like extracellular protein [Staphylococcus simiae]SNV68403.1 Allergen V5/Tpx-1 like protein [Staphylococcus simiae]
MKKLVIRVIGVLFLIGFLIYLFYSPKLKFDVLENPNKNTKITKSDKYKMNNHAENPKPKKGVGTWLGRNINILTKKYGQAERVYPYKEDYKNYIFKDENKYYIVTTKDKKIESVYATGKSVDVSPLKIGEHLGKVFNNTSINPEPTFTVNGKKYEFELSDEDIKTQMLIKYGDIYAQVYADQQSKEILSVRFLTKEMLAEIQPYQLNNNSLDSDDRKIEQPVGQSPNQLISLYEVTNEMRKLKGLHPLKVNSDLAHIASNNLYEATSSGNDSVEFTEDALKGQLDKNSISYKSTAQNVGYDFNDVPTLIHSWMNSDIHRSRLLNSKYDEMGGEVMRDYYSLIFLQK